MEYKVRQYPQFAACGLNCGLCPNYHLHTNGKFKCPGCAGEGFKEAHPSCGILSCCQRKGIEFCSECDEFPCKKFDSWGDSDSFITHRNYLTDMKKAKQIGIKAYIAEQNEKIDILSVLLRDYNDGRRKTFFCLAVNLLELEDIKAVIENIKKDTDTKAVVLLFEETAERRGVSLKKRK